MQSLQVQFIHGPPDTELRCSMEKNHYQPEKKIKIPLSLTWRTLNRK